MSASTRTLKQLFTALCRIQASSWFDQDARWNISDELYNAYATLAGQNWYPIREEEVGDWFSDLDRVALRPSRKQALYLPPMDEEPEVIPILSLQYDCGESADVMKLRVMLVRPQGGVFFGIGFRMEAGKSVHGFYHVQLIDSLGGAGHIDYGLPIECPEWLPKTQPAIPLRAKDSVTLMLCMLIGLYGIKFCWTFVTEHQISELKPYLDYFTSST